MTLDFKKAAPHLIALVVFVLVSVAYFLPQISGKVLTQSDIISYRATSQEIAEHRDQYGEEPLWTNSLFSGMPAYQISVRSTTNLLQYVKKVVYLGFKHPIGSFIFGMIGFYILMLVLGVNPYLAMTAGALYSLGTIHLVLLEAGHNSKIITLFSSAPVIAGIILTYRGHLLKGGLLFALAMGLNLMSNHPQMTYYLGLALLPLVATYLVQAVRNGEAVTFAKASGVLLIGLLLAVGSSYDRIATTIEYADDTMRGKPVLESTSGVASSSETDGLAYDYAMGWSNGASDLLVSWIPNVVGGRTIGTVSKDTPYGKVLRARQDVQTYTYFGGLPSTAGPTYFGAIIFYLFILFLFTGSGPLRWWSLVAVVFTFMLSMGSNLGWFNHFFFEYVPLYNKFRAHSSITGVTAVIVTLAGFYGLSQLLQREDKSAVLRPFMIGTGVIAGVTLLIAMLGPSLMDLTSQYDSQFAANPEVLDALLETRADMVKYSALRSLGFILAAAGLLYFYLKGAVNQGILIGAIALLGFADIVPVDKQYLGADNWATPRKSEATFAPRPVDTQILRDTDPHYRVMDTRQFNSALPSYHHKHIGGYHPAKLQRYEDLKNRYLISSTGQAIMDMNVINMLNTKYIIDYDQQGEPSAQRNTAALGNAWFVTNIQSVASANEELAALAGLDTRQTAVVHQEFADYVSGLATGNAGSIKLSSYKANELTYRSSTTQEGLAVFSEVWYGPDKGWQAYIDGQPADHIRVNYALRALRIPAGDHEVRFEFRPASYARAKTISFICSLLIILGGLLYMRKDYIPGLRNL